MIEEAGAVPDVPPTEGPGQGEEPVELLVQLATEGEIDPWDIDIVSVTDAFLAKLEEVDLRVSGRALFYASVLLRMKSDAMVQLDEPEADEEALADEPWEDAPPAVDDPIADLEAEMDRRLERKRARGSPETLDELIRELREIERRTWWKPHREYDTTDSPAGFARGTQSIEYHETDAYRMPDEPSEAEVTGATHTEDIEVLVDRVWAAIEEQFDAGRAEVLFAEIADVAGSRVETFLGVLFLADRGRVALEQDELFGDLWIADPSATVPVAGAAARNRDSDV